MGAIRHTLTERYYTWEDAVQVARSDPEIDMNAGEGQAYNPSAYEDEFDATGSWEEPTVEGDAASAGAPASTEGAAKSDNKTEKQPV